MAGRGRLGGQFRGMLKVMLKVMFKVMLKAMLRAPSPFCHPRHPTDAGAVPGGGGEDALRGPAGPGGVLAGGLLLR